MTDRSRQHQTGSTTDNDVLIEHPGEIPGYTYGTPEAGPSPLTATDLDQLKAAVGLTADDEAALRQAADILRGQADAIVTDWRARIGEHPHLARYSAHPDGSPNPEYAAASKPRFDRWILDACTRPLDHDWLDYQHEIGRRHTRAAKNTTDHADSADHIPLRYLLAFTAVVITTSRQYLAAHDHTATEVDRMHAAFTRAVMLHVTVWTRAYVSADW